MVNAWMTEQKKGDGTRKHHQQQPLDRQHIRSTLTLIYLCPMQVYHEGLQLTYNVHQRITDGSMVAVSFLMVWYLITANTLCCLNGETNIKLGFVV